MIEISPDRAVVVVGYPRSGNTYLTRILGDVLNSPIVPYRNAKPLSTEGADRRGLFRVMQLHLRPMMEKADTGLVDGWTFSIPAASGERIISIIRDPRDIAVSSMFYWDLSSIEATIIAMRDGTPPLNGVGPWHKFVESWLSDEVYKATNFRHVSVCFETLLQSPSFTIQIILNQLDLSYAHDRLPGVIARQAFSNRRAAIEKNGDSLVYGKSIQLKAMRKGVIGDWKNYFTPKDHDLMVTAFGETMQWLGYDNWEGLKEA